MDFQEVLILHKGRLRNWFVTTNERMTFFREMEVNIINDCDIPFSLRFSLLYSKSRIPRTFSIHTCISNSLHRSLNKYDP